MIYRLALSLLLIGTLTACDSSETSSETHTETQTEQKTESSTPAQSAQPPSAEAQNLLKTALNNTSTKLSSAHIEAELHTDKGLVPVEADAGKGTFEALIKRLDGKEAHHIIVGDKAVVSVDDGKTWQDDVEHSGQSMSVMLTFPFNPAAAALTKEPVSLVAEETIEGHKHTHLRVTTKDKPVDVWVTDLANVGPVVSRYQGVIEATDVSFDADISYSEHNQAVDIKLP